jgi:hypothetical protein
MSLFMLRGRGGAWWLPTVASPTGAPTASEIAAGQPLSAAFTAIQGLEPQSNKINVAVLKYKTEAQIGGPETFQNVSVTIAEDDGTGLDADALERKAALTVLVAPSSGVLILSRTKQTLTAADKVFSIAAAVDAQVPNWNLDASAAATQINLSPSTPLRAVAVLA